MAQTAGGRAAVLLALGAWFVLVLTLGATGALGAAGGGAPSLGLTVFRPSQRSLGLFRPALCAKRDGRDALPALIALHAIRLLGLCSSSSTPRPASRPVCAERGMGRRIHGRHRAAARLGFCAIRSPGAAARPLVERARGRRPRRRHQPWDAFGAGSASGFRRPSRRFANDDFALAHHSGFSRALSLFDVVIFARLLANPQPLGRRIYGAAPAARAKSA